MKEAHPYYTDPGFSCVQMQGNLKLDIFPLTNKNDKKWGSPIKPLLISPSGSGDLTTIPSTWEIKKRLFIFLRAVNRPDTASSGEALQKKYEDAKKTGEVMIKKKMPNLLWPFPWDNKARY